MGGHAWYYHAQVMVANALLRLERLRLQFDAAAAARKLALLQQLARSPLRSAGSVLRLHEALCFMRAYPDNAAVARRVQSMLADFARRPDLRAQRNALADSGIAGTAIHYRFFAGQAQWLAAHWPTQLRLDRSDAGTETRVATALPALLTPVERHALVELHRPGYAALDRLRGRRETDATFLLRRLAVMPGNTFTRESLVDAIDASMVLDPGRTSPSRTAAFFAPASTSADAPGPRPGRPALRSEIARAPRALRRLALPEAQAAVDLARAAMVTRARSLEAFSFADARDVWLVDDGQGLAYLLIGVLPERRHALATFYGGLALRNGVPVAYLQSDIVGRSAALSFNTFETFRGAEAGFLFARWLAGLHRVFGCSSFSIEPYQLGRENDEALDSGAWWFYAKLGFAPRAAAARALAQQEKLRMQRQPGRLSSRRTLARLAQHHLFFDRDAARHPLVNLAELGLQCGAAMAALAGSDRERAIDLLSAHLLHESRLTRLPRWSAPQREAWRRLVPVLALLDRSGWTLAERRALFELPRAKAARSERDFVRAFLTHEKLDAAVWQWARAAGPNQRSLT